MRDSNTLRKAGVLRHSYSKRTKNFASQVNSWEIWMKSGYVIFQLILVIDGWGISEEVTRPHWWVVSFDSCNGLVSSGNKPLPEPILLRSVSPYGVTRPQWVNSNTRYNQECTYRQVISVTCVSTDKDPYMWHNIDCCGTMITDKCFEEWMLIEVNKFSVNIKKIKNMILHSIRDVDNHIYEKELNGIAIETVNWFNWFC